LKKSGAGAPDDSCSAAGSAARKGGAGLRNPRVRLDCPRIGMCVVWLAGKLCGDHDDDSCIGQRRRDKNFLFKKDFAE
jgi:hypothetical protein